MFQYKFNVEQFYNIVSSDKKIPLINLLFQIQP